MTPRGLEGHPRNGAWAQQNESFLLLFVIAHHFELTGPVTTEGRTQDHDTIAGELDVPQNNTVSGGCRGRNWPRRQGSWPSRKAGPAKSLSGRSKLPSNLFPCQSSTKLPIRCESFVDRLPCLAVPILRFGARYFRVSQGQDAGRNLPRPAADEQKVTQGRGIKHRCDIVQAHTRFKRPHNAWQLLSAVPCPRYGMPTAMRFWPTVGQGRRGALNNVDSTHHSIRKNGPHVLMPVL